MLRSCFFLFILLFISSVLKAQSATVTEKYDQLFIGENFDSSNSYWTTLSNTDNLLIVQEGEYIMQRKASYSPYAVMANFKVELGAYRLVTSLKLDKTSAPEGSIGIIFMAQPEGKGGFIFEINKDQKYRLRRITGNNYQYISGLSKEFGWVRNDVVKGLNLPNLVEVRTADKKYDLFVNNSLLVSFEEIEYKMGDIGFIIGPASKGKADFLYLFTNQKAKEVQDGSTLEANTASSPESDIIALAESIITLKTQMNKLQEENDDLKGMIASMKAGKKEQELSKFNYEKQIRSLEVQIKKASFSFDSLIKINIELGKYKEMVKGNDNGDLVINLSKNLKNEKLVNDELRKTNKTLVDSIQLLKTQLKDAKSKTLLNSSNRNKETIRNDTLIKPKDAFILPKEN